MIRSFCACFVLGCFTKKSRRCPGGNMFIHMKIPLYTFDRNLLEYFLKKLPELIVWILSSAEMLSCIKKKLRNSGGVVVTTNIL
jgi:hypothetical protein